MADRYDLLSYPVRLRSGNVADDAVSIDESAAERARDRGDKVSAVLAVALVLVGSVVFELWGFAVVLGGIYVVVTVLLSTGPTNEVVETECRAVPAGAGERVIGAHERAIERHRRRRLAGLAAVGALTLVVAYIAGAPEGLVTIGGFAVLLAYGALTEPKTTVRTFAPELVREGVSRGVAEAEAVRIVEEPFSRDEAPLVPDPGETGTAEGRDGVEQASNRR